MSDFFLPAASSGWLGAVDVKMLGDKHNLAVLCWFVSNPLVF